MQTISEVFLPKKAIPGVKISLKCETFVFSSNFIRLYSTNSVLWLVGSCGDENRILAVSVLAYKNDGTLQLFKNKWLNLKYMGTLKGRHSK